MVGNRYELQRKKLELREIEKDLAAYLHVPFIKCSYDGVHSHMFQEEREIEYRNKEAEKTGLWEMCDYVINYEKYETRKDYEANNGGYDGNVYELFYLKGNGNYIVITGCSE